MALGNFTSVAGARAVAGLHARPRADQATLNPWYYQPLENLLRSQQSPAYLRDVDFSPDGSYFVFVSTGYVPRSGGVGRDLCDAAARFETSVAQPSRPTWINYTGGDTLHSVAVTGAAVYVQGHQRWLDNPLGRRLGRTRSGVATRDRGDPPDAGDGAALEPRPRPAAWAARTSWSTSAGLWVGSDGQRFAGEYRARIAFCPALAGDHASGLVAVRTVHGGGGAGSHAAGTGSS